MFTKMTAAFALGSDWRPLARLSPAAARDTLPSIEADSWKTTAILLGKSNLQEGFQ